LKAAFVLIACHVPEVPEAAITRSDSPLQIDTRSNEPFTTLSSYLVREGFIRRYSFASSVT
jgi:hypothetical protein